MIDQLAPPCEPWYGSGLRFRCTRCGHCCSGGPGYVWVTVEEAARLARLLALSLDAFAREHLRNVSGRLSLRETPSGHCSLLDPEEGRCRAYAGRPDQCRSYPFWPGITASPTTWNREAEVCPGIGEEARVSAKEIQALRQLVADRVR